MGRKAPKGYYVDGEFVVRGSADDAAATDDSPSRTARKKASEDLQRIGEGLLARLRKGRKGISGAMT